MRYLISTIISAAYFALIFALLSASFAHTVTEPVPTVEAVHTDGF